jgi:hypothetical protein
MITFKLPLQCTGNFPSFFLSLKTSGRKSRSRHTHKLPEIFCSWLWQFATWKSTTMEVPVKLDGLGCIHYRRLIFSHSLNISFESLYRGWISRMWTYTYCFPPAEEERGGDLGFHPSHRHLPSLIFYQEAMGPHLLCLPLLQREGVETLDLRSALW